MKAKIKHSEGTGKVKARQVSKLHFVILPGYAGYVLREKLRDFIATQLELMIENDFPMLQHANYEGHTIDQIIDLSIASHTEFLTSAIENKLSEYIDQTLTKWKADELPNISRDQLVAEDITLSAYIRKMALLKFIPCFTGDPSVVLELVKEIEQYTTVAETRSFNTFIDIHNKKINTMNSQLENSAGELLEAQELANLGSFEWDLNDNGKLSFTPQVSKIFEIEKLGSLLELLPNVIRQDRIKLQRAVDAALKGRREYECEFRYLAGDREKTIWSRGVVEIRDGKPFRMKGTVMDITARQLMLRKLEKNQELYKQAEKLAHLGNWTYDLRTGEITWSDELFRIFNLAPQSKEITLDFFMELVHPGDRDKIRPQFKRILTDQQLDYRLRVVLPGDKTKFLVGKGQVVKDPNNKISGIMGSCQDITREMQMHEELKRREENLALLNTSLEQKNIELNRKNEELTSFNYIASHDLQEPLRKIKTFSDLVLTREKDHLSGAGKGWLERISTAAGRMQKLIQDLLSFSRTQLFDGVRQEVDLTEIMETIRSTYEAEITQGVLQIDCCQLPPVVAVPFQIHQLFENLVSNAVKYRREGCGVILKVSCEEAEVIGSGKSQEKKYLRISFADNGIGFEQKYAAKIFEIFQRLHGQLSYSGTGIGLAICKKIVENHDGFMRARSIPGQGATFDVYFPKGMVLPVEQLPETQS